MQTDGDPANNSFSNEYMLEVDTSAVYRIQCVGELDESWTDRFGGLKINSSSQGNRQTITTLSGLLPDQTALFVVLQSLYDLRLPLLSVMCIEDS